MIIPISSFDIKHNSERRLWRQSYKKGIGYPTKGRP